jgi:hypothetical protein
LQLARQLCQPFHNTSDRAAEDRCYAELRATATMVAQFGPAGEPLNGNIYPVSSPTITIYYHDLLHPVRSGYASILQPGYDALYHDRSLPRSGGLAMSRHERTRTGLLGGRVLAPLDPLRHAPASCAIMTIVVLFSAVGVPQGVLRQKAQVHLLGESLELLRCFRSIKLLPRGLVADPIPPHAPGRRPYVGGVRLDCYKRRTVQASE